MTERKKRSGGQTGETGFPVVVEESAMDSKELAWVHKCGTVLTDKKFPGDLPPVPYCSECETPPEKHPKA